jgi:hypothetical protein
MARRRRTPGSHGATSIAKGRGCFGCGARATRTAGVHQDDVVSASVFTTLSATVILEKTRDQIKVTTPCPPDLHLGPGGSRTVFPVSSLTGIFFNRQLTTASILSTTFLFELPGPLDVVPGAVGYLAFGKYLSPDYRTADRIIPPVGTRTGVSIVQTTNEIYFNLFLPSGPKPSPGLVGHDLRPRAREQQTDHSLHRDLVQAGRAGDRHDRNQRGIGFGPLSSLTLTRASEGPVTFPAGSRGVDVNGDGIIESPEGLFAAAPFTLVREWDGRVQTVVDLMQLARLIEVGIDLDGDGVPDLDPQRIYYSGISLGGFYGTKFVAVEPSIRASVLNVVGGPASRQLGSARRSGAGSEAPWLTGFRR